MVLFLQLKIIISDASVPGEGEHKIMDWIRRERSYPEYDANTSHVIYGLVSNSMKYILDIGIYPEPCSCRTQI
jgi:5'-3' exonuclease